MSAHGALRRIQNGRRRTAAAPVPRLALDGSAGRAARRAASRGERIAALFGAPRA